MAQILQCSTILLLLFSIVQCQQFEEYYFHEQKVDHFDLNQTLLWDQQFYFSQIYGSNTTLIFLCSTSDLECIPPYFDSLKQQQKREIILLKARSMNDDPQVPISLTQHVEDINVFIKAIVDQEIISNANAQFVLVGNGILATIAMIAQTQPNSLIKGVIAFNALRLSQQNHNWISDATALYAQLQKEDLKCLNQIASAFQIPLTQNSCQPAKGFSQKKCVQENQTLIDNNQAHFLDEIAHTMIIKDRRDIICNQLKSMINIDDIKEYLDDIKNKNIGDAVVSQMLKCWSIKNSQNEVCRGLLKESSLEQEHERILEQRRGNSTQSESPKSKKKSSSVTLPVSNVLYINQQGNIRKQLINNCQIQNKMQATKKDKKNKKAKAQQSNLTCIEVGKTTHSEVSNKIQEVIAKWEEGNPQKKQKKQKQSKKDQVFKKKEGKLDMNQQSQQKNKK